MLVRREDMQGLDALLFPGGVIAGDAFKALESGVSSGLEAAGANAAQGAAPALQAQLNQAVELAAQRARQTLLLGAALAVGAYLLFRYLKD